ncbi:MAG TPA: DUF6602 domain-containing protein [Verrucomicrobiae bacterium]|nr:DUF6602 domain-containing protein [Verrucomicrobiae bacterium]
MNVDAYDSGPGTEDIIRDELRQILPTRYAVKAGVINDLTGKTGGDFDVVIFNEMWFPAVKAGATPQSRRVHFPIDGVYAICEVKQSLNLATFDEAMEKLVTCHRLYRPRTYAYRTVENREGSSCSHGLTNPLYSAIIATGLRDGTTFKELVDRYYEINKTLKRLEVVRALCILGWGAVTWGWRKPNGEGGPALFMLEDLYEPIFPILHEIPYVESAFFVVTSDLLLHLFHSVLAPEDLPVKYGPSTFDIQVPKSPEIVLPPDAEWVQSLKYRCSASDPTHPQWWRDKCSHDSTADPTC